MISPIEGVCFIPVTAYLMLENTPIYIAMISSNKRLMKPVCDIMPPSYLIFINNNRNCGKEGSRKRDCQLEIGKCRGRLIININCNYDFLCCASSACR